MKQTKLIKCTGIADSAPLGARIEYTEGSHAWHVYVDFACMPKREFTLAEVYKYHGLDTCNPNGTAETYYNDSILAEFKALGLIEIKTEGE